ncbi:14819_t:CDS:2, partial [Gigaspora margarita]
RILKKPTHTKDFFDILVTENDPNTGCPFSDETNPEVKARLQKGIGKVLK